MADMDDRAREYWQTAQLLHQSPINSITRRLALGRVLTNQSSAQLPQILRRFAALAAAHMGELQAFQQAGRRSS